MFKSLAATEVIQKPTALYSPRLKLGSDEEGFEYQSKKEVSDEAFYALIEAARSYLLNEENQTLSIEVRNESAPQ